MTAVLRAELTKAASTRLLRVSLALALLLPPALAALLGLAMGQRQSYCAVHTCRNALPLPDETVSTIGVLGDGVPGAALTVLTAFAAALLLVELRYNTLSTAFLVTSRRSQVALAKVVLVAAVGLPVVFVATLGSGVVFAQVAGDAAARVSPLSAAAVGVAARSTLVVLALALMAFGVAALTRNLWITAAIVVAWPNFLETLLPVVVPGGEDLVRFLPVANARHVVGLDAGPVPWSPAVSALYLTALTVLLVALGTRALVRADMPRSA
jgi:ABC-2 type transport system permease protein